MGLKEEAAVMLLEKVVGKLPPDHRKSLEWFLGGLRDRHVPEAHFLALQAAWLAGYRARGGEL